MEYRIQQTASFHSERSNTRTDIIIGIIIIYAGTVHSLSMAGFMIPREIIIFHTVHVPSGRVPWLENKTPR